MSKWFSSILIIILILIIIIGGYYLIYKNNNTQLQENNQQVDKSNILNIVQNNIKSLIVEEAGENIIYKGVTLKTDSMGGKINDEPFEINNTKISFLLAFDYFPCVPYSVKGSIDKVFINKNGLINKISLSEIDELKKEEILSVEVIVNKKISFIENIKQFFNSMVLARSCNDPEIINNPDQIIFKTTNKRSILVTGKKYGTASAYVWTFIPDQNQGIHVQEEGANVFITKVTYPKEYYLKFQNNKEYFAISGNNFNQNLNHSDLIENITIRGEENCPDYNIPCLISAESVKVETNLLLEDDRIFKLAKNNGIVNYFYCPDSLSGGNCYVWLDRYTGLKKDTIYFKDSTEFVNGSFNDIAKGKSIEVEGIVEECPGLTDVMSGEVEKSFIGCKFFAEKVFFNN